MKNKLEKLKVRFPTSPIGDPFHLCKQQSSPLAHEKKAIFKCDICSKEFPKKVRLRSHVKSIYDKKKPFKCDSCPSYFGQR